MDDRTRDEATTVPSPATGALSLGTIHGKYKLIEKIGEGGMGVVYRAEQDAPVRRVVALKIIKAGLETKQVMARFASEEQALAIMTHPNIAKMFDAGVTDEGRAYFVMEYVPGMPITEYCDFVGLPTRQRLALFADVCDAIQHAHQKGVIHRDIKPPNILVSTEGTAVVPKIIDFGVAKAIAHPLTEHTLYTEQGVFIGTPEYMSPEQAGVTGLDIDTRSDVYSLGVVLYELLTGVLPLDPRALRRAALMEMQRIIRDSEPPRPSARVSTLGATATDVAQRRHTDITSLQRELRGDIDWVVMRALEKDRTRRYASASEFAADVRRLLADQPVLAGRPTAWYRVQKFALRNKGLVTASLAVLSALLLGLAGTTAMYLAAQRATVEKEEQRKNAAWQAYVANIQAADAGLRVHEVTEAKRRLAACDPALRNWEWRYLSGQADSSVAVLKGARGPVRAFFSPDGSRVLGVTWWATRAATDDEKALVIWDRSTGHTSSRIDNQALSAVSPDGTRLVSKGFSIVEASSGTTVSVLEELTAPLDSGKGLRPKDVTAIAFSADGTSIGTGGAGGEVTSPFVDGYGTGPGDRTVRVWDVKTGKLRATLSGHRDSIWALAFAPDGKHVVSGSQDHSARVWDINRASLVTTLNGHNGSVIAVGFSSAGDRVATGSMDKSVRIWDAVSGALLQTMTGHDLRVTSVAFSPDGTQIASGSWDKTVRVWDARSGREIACFHGHDAGVESVAYDQLGGQIVSGSLDGSVRLWDAPRASALERIVSEGIADLQYSGNGEVVATSSLSRITTWNPSSGQPTTTIRADGENTAGSYDEARVLAVDDAGSVIASGRSRLRLWNTQTGQLLATVDEHPVSALAFRPRARQIARGAQDHAIEILDLDTLKKLRVLAGHEAAVDALSYSPDGAALASASEDGTVRIWDAASGRPLHVFDGSTERVHGLRFSPDGRRVASAAGDGTARVWDLAFPQSAMILRGHDSDWLETVAFSPDGSRIITAARDRTVRVWDSATGDQLLVLRHPSEDPSGAIFSPDGKAVLSWVWSDTEQGRVWAVK